MSKRFLVTLPVVVVALAALATYDASAQLNPGKLEGTLVDPDGQPFGGVTLLFSPADDSPVSARKVKVNKKGRFAYSFFPAGVYVVSLVEDEDAAGMWLKSMTYSLLDDGGLEIDRQETDAHPTKGLPSISIRPHRTVVLDLVIAPKEVQEQLAMEVAVSESRGPLKEMSDLYAAGDFEGVIAVSDELLAEKPDLGPAIYLRGVAMWKLSRLQDSYDNLRRAIELVPDQEGIYGVTGSVTMEYADQLAAAGQTEQATALYAEAAEDFATNLSLNPDSQPSRLSRAAALDKAGMEDELEAALLEVIEVDPSYLQAYFRLSNLYMQSERPDQALAILDRIPSGDKSVAGAIYNVAVKLYNEDDLAAAELAAKKAIDADPELPAPHRLLARIYLAQGNDEAAIPSIERFLELAPNDPEAEDERQLLEALKAAAS